MPTVPVAAVAPIVPVAAVAPTVPVAAVAPSRPPTFDRATMNVILRRPNSDLDIVWRHGSIALPKDQLQGKPPIAVEGLALRGGCFIPAGADPLGFEEIKAHEALSSLPSGCTFVVKGRGGRDQVPCGCMAMLLRSQVARPK